jgi:hypothetical protein
MNDIKVLIKDLLALLVVISCIIFFMVIFTPSARGQSKDPIVIENAHYQSTAKTGKVNTKGITAFVWDDQITFSLSPTAVFTVIRRPSGEWMQHGTDNLVIRVVETDGTVVFWAGKDRNKAYYYKK